MNFSFPKARREYLRAISVTACAALFALSGCDAVERIRDKNRIEPIVDFAKRGSVSKLELKTTPKTLQARKRALWSLKVLWKVPPKDASEYIRDFRFIDEHVFHLYVVSSDRRFFSHLLPEPRDYGHFLVETSLPRAGKYLLLSEYAPHQALPELKRFSIPVKPSDGAQVSLPSVPPLLSSPDKETKSAATLTQLDIAGNPKLDADGTARSAPSPYSVVLEAKSSLVAGEEVTFHATAKSADGSVPKLQMYLGNAGFFSALSQGDESFARGVSQKFPPSTREYSPDLARAGTDFTMRFPRAGRYTLWCEFGLERAKIVAPFDIEIASGETKSQPATKPARPTATR